MYGDALILTLFARGSVSNNIDMRVCGDICEGLAILMHIGYPGILIMGHQYSISQQTSTIFTGRLPSIARYGIPSHRRPASPRPLRDPTIETAARAEVEVVGALARLSEGSRINRRTNSQSISGTIRANTADSPRGTRGILGQQPAVQAPLAALPRHLAEIQRATRQETRRQHLADTGGWATDPQGDSPRPAQILANI